MKKLSFAVLFLFCFHHSAVAEWSNPKRLTVDEVKAKYASLSACFPGSTRTRYTDAILEAAKKGLVCTSPFVKNKCVSAAGGRGQPKGSYNPKTGKITFRRGIWDDIDALKLTFLEELIHLRQYAHICERWPWLCFETAREIGEWFEGQGVTPDNLPPLDRQNFRAKMGNLAKMTSFLADAEAKLVKMTEIKHWEMSCVDKKKLLEEQMKEMCRYLEWYNTFKMKLQQAMDTCSVESFTSLFSELNKWNDRLADDKAVCEQFIATLDC